MQGRTTQKYAENILFNVSSDFEFTVGIKIDSGFTDFNSWCSANDIPVVIVSRYPAIIFYFPCHPFRDLIDVSGMAPIIRAVLSNFVSDEVANSIDIIANDVEIEPNGHWTIKFRHPTRLFPLYSFPAILI